MPNFSKDVLNRFWAALELALQPFSSLIGPNTLKLSCIFALEMSQSQFKGFKGELLFNMFYLSSTRIPYKEKQNNCFQLVLTVCAYCSYKKETLVLLLISDISKYAQRLSISVRFEQFSIVSPEMLDSKQIFKFKQTAENNLKTHIMQIQNSHIGGQQGEFI